MSQQPETEEQPNYVVSRDLYSRYRQYCQSSTTNKKRQFIDTLHSKLKFIDHLLNFNVSYFEIIQECAQMTSYTRCFYTLKDKNNENLIFVDTPLEKPFLKWEMNVANGDAKIELYRYPTERSIWEYIDIDFEHARKDFVYIGHAKPANMSHFQKQYPPPIKDVSNSSLSASNV